MYFYCERMKKKTKLQNLSEWEWIYEEFELLYIFNWKEKKNQEEKKMKTTNHTIWRNLTVCKINKNKKHYILYVKVCLVFHFGYLSFIRLSKATFQLFTLIHLSLNKQCFVFEYKQRHLLSSIWVYLVSGY